MCSTYSYLQVCFLNCDVGNLPIIFLLLGDIVGCMQAKKNCRDIWTSARCCFDIDSIVHDSFEYLEAREKKKE